MAHIVTCIYCKKKFDRDKSLFVQVSNRRYAHPECSAHSSLPYFHHNEIKRYREYVNNSLYRKLLFKMITQVIIES